MPDSPWSNQRNDLIILQENVSGFSGLFGYSPSIGAGNLIFSVAAVAGTDPYGNAYPAGLSITGANSTITGTNYIINVNGAFFYSGTPALGNLIASIASAAGTDSFGNVYVAGFGAYKSLNATIAQLFNGAVQISQHAASTAGGISTGGSDGSLFLFSPIQSGGGTNAGLTLNDSAHSSGGPFNMNYPSGLAANVQGAQLASFPNITVTAASLTQFSGNFAIPANDMVAGATYELKVHGAGTQGSTAQGLAMAAMVAGAAVGQTPQSGAGFAAASQFFTWDAIATLVCHTTGSSGTCQTSLVFTLTQPAAASNSETISAGTSADSAINTTIANNFAIGAKWGSTTGAPTMTSDFASFRRVA